MNQINVARDFTPYPGGRYPEDGDGNGSDFRSRFLVPAIENKQRIIVSLDDAYGYPSSFLEEAFGGLIRLGYSRDMIRRYITVTAAQPAMQRYLMLIEEFILRAASKPLQTST